MIWIIISCNRFITNITTNSIFYTLYFYYLDESFQFYINPNFSQNPIYCFRVIFLVLNISSIIILVIVTSLSVLTDFPKLSRNLSHNMLGSTSNKQLLEIFCLVDLVCLFGILFLLYLTCLLTLSCLLDQTCLLKTSCLIELSCLFEPSCLSEKSVCVFTCDLGEESEQNIFL